LNQHSKGNAIFFTNINFEKKMHKQIVNKGNYYVPLMFLNVWLQLMVKLAAKVAIFYNLFDIDMWELLFILGKYGRPLNTKINIYLFVKHFDIAVG